MQLFVWTALPLLFLKNTYVDILENLAWGQHWQWGYDKDPFLGAVVTKAGIFLGHGAIWSAYLLSQICVVISFLVVWQFAKRIMPPLYALIAVVLLTTINYYNLFSPEFNDNVLLLMLWACTCLFFYDAIKEQRYQKWILTGFFAGLALMTKYSSIILFGAMLLFLLCNKTARKTFSKTEPYIALVVFFIIITPNIIWLIKHDFISITYALNRGAVNEQSIINFGRHIKNPLRFFVDIFMQVIPLLLIFFICFWRRCRSRIALDSYNMQYLICICFCPLLLIFLFSFVTGARIKLMWGAPLLSFVGVLLLYWYQPLFTPKRLYCFGFLIVAVFIFTASFFIWDNTIHPFMKQKGKYNMFPGDAVATKLTKEWEVRYHRPLQYVAGDRLIVVNISYYSTDHPDGYFEWNPKVSPWIHEKDLRKQGAVFVWNVKKRALPSTTVLKRFPRMEIQTVHKFDWAIRYGNIVRKLFHFKPIPPVKIGVAFLPPNSDALCDLLN